MKKSFVNNSQPEVSTDIFDETGVGEETALATQQSVMSISLGAVDGAISKKDVLVPSLHMVQAVGPLSVKFGPSGVGGFALNKEYLIYTVGSPALNVTVLNLNKYYEDRTPYDPNGPIPRKYYSIAEVHAAGLYADWRPGKNGRDEAPPVREVADILLLIEKPEGVECPSFTWDLEGKAVSVAKWTVRNTAYPRTAKRVITAAAVELAKAGVMAGRWTLGSAREKIGSNYVYVPVMSLRSGLHSPETVGVIRELFNR